MATVPDLFWISDVFNMMTSNSKATYFNLVLNS